MSGDDGHAVFPQTILLLLAVVKKIGVLLLPCCRVVAVWGSKRRQSLSYMAGFLLHPVECTVPSASVHGTLKTTETLNHPEQRV